MKKQLFYNKLKRSSKIKKFVRKNCSLRLRLRSQFFIPTWSPARVYGVPDGTPIGQGGT